MQGERKRRWEGQTPTADYDTSRPSMPGWGGFQESLRQVPKAHSSFMFASPEQKLSVLDKLRRRYNVKLIIFRIKKQHHKTMAETTR